MHIETDGVFARSMVSPSSIQPREFHAQGATASAASVTAGATVVNTGSTAAATSLAFALYNADGQPVGSSVSADVSVAAAANSSSPATAASKTVSIDVPAPELWSVARPYVYTLVVTSSEGDVYNTTLGIYSTKWTGDHGFFLNNEHVKIRGFCNHESFGGVGMAIPDRINLFRAQALRSVGGNGWRMSVS